MTTAMPNTGSSSCCCKVLRHDVEPRVERSLTFGVIALHHFRIPVCRPSNPKAINLTYCIAVFSSGLMIGWAISSGTVL